MNLILEKFNLEGFRFINNLAGHSVWLDRFMIFVADQMGYFLVLGVLFLAWKNSGRVKILVLTIGSAMIARAVFVELIRYFFYNPRPYLVLENVNILINHETSSSFPSGHASFYFALATGVYLYNNRAKPSSNPRAKRGEQSSYDGGLYGHKKIGRIYLVLAGLMGFARVFVSVHWPLDILAGALLGIVTALVFNYLVNYLKQKMSRRTLMD